MLNSEQVPYVAEVDHVDTLKINGENQYPLDRLVQQGRRLLVGMCVVTVIAVIVTVSLMSYMVNQVHQIPVSLSVEDVKLIKESIVGNKALVAYAKGVEYPEGKLRLATVRRQPVALEGELGGIIMATRLVPRRVARIVADWR